MPYYITDKSPDCSGWATIAETGRVVGCHTTKQDAIDQMVAVSIQEGMRPGGERALPDNYRPALDQSVPDGRACGNCYFYDETNMRGDKAWCEKWDDYVSGAYYCNAWQPEGEERAPASIPVETRATPPNYMQTAAARGLELRSEGFAGDGVTDQTVREAREMADGNISDDKIIRAYAWSQRHAVDLEASKNRNTDDPEWPGAGAVAHYLWGIDPTDPRPATRWLERESNRLQGRTEMSAIEIRTFAAEVTEIRAMENGDGMTFGGYAWRYNAPSLPLPFTERIAPGAFTRTLKSKNDIRAYVNHDDTLLLGSTRAKTLRIEDRPEGGYVEIDLPDTTAGRDIRALVARGDITGMSFGFSTVKDAWSVDGNERTLNEVRLHEVSVVTGVPAYPQTTASVRAMRDLATRASVDVDALALAINELQAGNTLTADQVATLFEVINTLKLSDDGVVGMENLGELGYDGVTHEGEGAMHEGDGTEIEVEASVSIPISLLQKQIDLAAKTFGI
jgi:HK97 family phage prohead protease